MTGRPPVKPPPAPTEVPAPPEVPAPTEVSVRPAAALLGLLPLLLAVGLVSGLALREAPLARGDAPPAVAEACEGAAAFAPLWDDGAVMEREGGFLLGGVGAVSAPVCGPGVLNVTARGELAGDELPLLTVSLGARPLAAFPVGEAAQDFQVRVPGPGLLSVGYPNDFYDSRYRFVTLQDMTCAGEARPNATLVHEAVVIACAGELTLRATPGEHGAGVPPEAPRLRLSAGDTVLGEWELRGETPLQVATPGEVTAEVQNPYSEQLADRNLIVETLSFTPDR